MEYLDYEDSYIQLNSLQIHESYLNPNPDMRKLNIRQVRRNRLLDLILEGK